MVAVRGAPVFRVKVGRSVVWRLWFTPDAGSVVAQVDSTFHRIRLDGTARVEAVPTGGLTQAADVAPDLSAVAGIRQLRPDDDPESGVLYPDGRWLSLGPAGQIDLRAFSADGSRLWGRADKAIVSWDPHTGLRRETIPIAVVPHHLAPSPDHRWLAFSAVGPAVTVLDAADEDGWLMLPKLPGSWISAAWSPDARWLAVGTPSGLALYDVPAGRLAQHVWGHGGSVTAVAFDPTGTRLFTGGEDEGVRLWQVDGSGLTKGPAFDWGIDGVWSVAVSADGLLCAAGGRWGAVAVWDLDG